MVTVICVDEEEEELPVSREENCETKQDWKCKFLWPVGGSSVQFCHPTRPQVLSQNYLAQRRQVVV